MKTTARTKTSLDFKYDFRDALMSYAAITSNYKFKGEGHSKKRIFLSTPIRILYWVKLLTEVSASKVHSIQEICLQSSLKFGIDNRHFETNAQRPGRARPLSVTSSLPRYFVLGSVFVYSRSWLIFNLTVLSQNVFLILRIANAKTKK